MMNGKFNEGLKGFSSLVLLKELMYREIDYEAAMSETNPDLEEIPEDEPVEPHDLSPAGRFQQKKPASYPAVCSVCKAGTTVPFKPNDKWPVYCRACYDKKNGVRK